MSPTRVKTYMRHLPHTGETKEVAFADVLVNRDFMFDLDLGIPQHEAHQLVNHWNAHSVQHCNSAFIYWIP